MEDTPGRTETPAEVAARKDRERKERRLAWEASLSPDEIAAADHTRLTMLRLKLRLKGMVEQVIQREGLLRDAQEIAAAGATRRVRRSLATGAGAVMRDCQKIRKETRCVQIAHGFMRGRAYAEMEQICWTKPDWNRVLEIVNRHAHGNSQAFWQGYEQWYQAARQHLRESFKGSEPSESEVLGRLLRRRAKLDSAISEFGAPQP